MHAFFQDLRQALRTLRASPWFTLVAVLTLGVGIGANVAIFSFVNGLLLRPFPFEGLNQLVTLWETRPNGSKLSDAHSVSGQRTTVSAATLADLAAGTGAFERVESYRYREFTLSGPKGPEWEQGVAVTPGFFELLRVKPLLGRTFQPGEDQPERSNVCIITYPLWKRFFHSDPGVIGQRLDLNYGALTVTVVGVMPEDYDFPMGGVRVIVPLVLNAQERDDRGARVLFPMARLRPGHSASSALADLQVAMQAVARNHPTTHASWGTAIVPLKEVQIAYTAPFGILFQGAAVFLLLIACANIANLLLARANARGKEIAVRVSMGASRLQIVRQLLTESLLLSLLGGALAAWLGWRGVELIRTTVPENIQWFVAGWKEIRTDWSTLVFTLLAAIVTTVIFGLIPALHASKVDLSENLKERVGPTGSRLRRRLGNALVIAEVALALVLLVGSGLMVRGFRGLQGAYTSYDPENVISLRVNLPEDVYTERHQMAAFYQNVLREVAKSVPDAQQAAFVTNIIGSLRGLTSGPVTVEGSGVVDPEQRPVADVHSVSPSYFQLMNIKLVEGRSFREDEGPDTERVCVVGQAMASRLWPGQSALGKRIKVGTPVYMSANHPSESAEPPWATVVGVTPDGLQYWIDKQPRSAVYLPAYQVPRREMSLLLRTTIGKRIVDAGRKAILAVDKGRPAYGVRTAAEVINQNLSIILVFSALMAVFGVVALLLSALGVYGLMAYQMSQRTHEVGIRMALGARSRNVLMMALRQTGVLVLLGLGLGLPVALLLNRAMATFLFGVAGFSVPSVVAVALGLALVALLASYLPAQRASSVDPVVALRYE